MAYLAFQDLGGAAAARAIAGAATPAPSPAGETERLTMVEWLVVSLARRDGLGSLRPDGRLMTVVRRIFRLRNLHLADGRLETLRRTAVLTWHTGYAIPASRVAAFLAAGFTLGQYEIMVNAINAARSALGSRTAMV